MVCPTPHRCQRFDHDTSLVLQVLCLPEVTQGLHVDGMRENPTWDLGRSDIKESGGTQQPTGEEGKEDPGSWQQAKDEQSQETQWSVQEEVLVKGVRQCQQMKSDEDGDLALCWQPV